MNKLHGLQPYFDWADRKANITRFRKWLAMMASIALIGCVSVHQPKPEIVPTPIAAFDFIQCGGALALFVIVDPTHVIRFDQKQTTIFTIENGKMTETNGPPTPFSQALQIAETAGITSNAIAPCGKPEATT